MLKGSLADLTKERKMKCPECGYEYKGCTQKEAGEEKIFGNFFILSNDVKMKRPVAFDSDDVRQLYGCPRCLKVFMQF